MVIHQVTHTLDHTTLDHTTTQGMLHLMEAIIPLHMDIMAITILTTTLLATMDRPHMVTMTIMENINPL